MVLIYKPLRSEVINTTTICALKSKLFIMGGRIRSQAFQQLLSYSPILYAHKEWS